MSKRKSIPLTVQAQVKDFNQELDIVNALQTIATNISPENLVLLAQKSKKSGINQKIKLYKNLI